MSLPSYINDNIEELVENAPPSVLAIIDSDEISNSTIILAEKYAIPVGQQEALADVITYTLLGALQPEDVVQALQDLALLSYDQALDVATELEFSIFEKARISLLKKEVVEKKLRFFNNL
jgi:type III secretion system FlhB-like substrate exporter